MQAIQKDDSKAFHAFMGNAQCGTYTLGRFPVLSLLYLYQSRKILACYEERFLKITSYEALREPVEVAKKFARKAGKCLRLYLSELVSPLEMLLILDRTKHLKRIYPLTKPSGAVKGRLQSIYAIKYALNVKFEGGEIVMDRRPLNAREKKNIATVCVCAVLGVALAVSVPVTTVSLLPKAGEVTRLSQIDFLSQKEYTLKKDIVLPEDFSVERVNCKIVGEGKKLIFGKGASLGVFNGQMSDLTIESAGDAVFTTVTNTAIIENVTLNAHAEVTVTEGFAFLALTNYGTIDGVRANIGGTISARASSEESEEPKEVVCAGLVLHNDFSLYNPVTQELYGGVIKNCTVNYSEVQLIGDVSVDAVFGGVVGINDAHLFDCTVTGEIAASTFDLSGVCVDNNWVLSGNINEANLSQTATGAEWNPIVSGIVLRNYYVVKACKNSGAIHITGDSTAYAGGIAAISFSQISVCVSSGEIAVTAKDIYAGGIVGHCGVAIYEDYIYFGLIEYCVSECRLNVTPADDAPAHVGGIAGCISEEGFQADTMVYMVGWIVNCYFTGACEKEVDYFGNIVGVCGRNIYENNSFVLGDDEYHNFEGNYYLQNSSAAFGATVTKDGAYALAEDKGAASLTEDKIKEDKIYQAILRAFEE